MKNSGMPSTKEHWDQVFATKSDQEKSWYEEFPYTSLSLMQHLGVSRDAAIIDIGGGDSHFVDALLSKGYTNLSVLDISEKALGNAKARLGKSALQVNWILSDILDFHPPTVYDLWHDRAVFHFITQEASIQAYLDKAFHALKKGGHFILATFSEKGPEKCSGLPVSRYSPQKMMTLLAPYFQKIKCVEDVHKTPFHTVQSFTFCGFCKKDK